MKHLSFALVVLFLASFVVHSEDALAQAGEDTDDIKAELALLKKRIEELEKKLAEQPPQPPQTSKEQPPTREEESAPTSEKGFKFDWTERLTLHGYGELHYNSRRSSSVIRPGSELPAVLDFHRFVWGLRYRFTDRIVMDSEIDFEHATDEIEFEFAHLDFLWRDALNFRAGSLLMPIGSLNEFHEPALFHSVERPYFHNFIIPTTWAEGGAGVFGAAGDFSYRAYLVTGLSAVKQDGDDESAFSPATGIRGGRQSLQNDEKSWAEDLAFAGRVEWKGKPGLRLGASLYAGRSSQNAEDAGIDVGDAPVTILEADARYDVAGFQLKGEFARIRVGNAAALSAALGQTMGRRIEGGCLEAAYNVFHEFGRDDELFLFARYEDLDTHARVPEGLASDPRFARTVRTIGVSFRPNPQIALKGDVELWEDDADQNLTRFNLGFAYDF